MRAIERHAPRRHAFGFAIASGPCVMAMDQQDCARIPAQREPRGQATGTAGVKDSSTGQPDTPWDSWLAGRAEEKGNRVDDQST